MSTDAAGNGAPRMCILAVGSNIEPEKNVANARKTLAQEQRLLGESQFVWTRPVGYQNQDDFLNGAFLIETGLDPKALKEYLQEVERRLGRIKGPIKSGPRTIDLDIIVYDNEVVHDDYQTAAYVRTPVDELIDRFGIRLSP